MFKFSKSRHTMVFEADRPYVSKKLSPWEIERIERLVPELKNPCVDEWTLTILPRELSWLIKPSLRRMEIFGRGYTLFWEDGYFRDLDGDEASLIRDYLKNRTTLRLEMIEYGDLPGELQELWKRR